VGSRAHAAQRDPLSRTGEARHDGPAVAARPVPSPVAGDLRELVQAARDGDRAAFDGLVRLTYRDAFRLALRLTADEEDARDVVQEAYLRAYRGLRRFRGEAQFTTWLYRITANCAATHVSRSSKHRHLRVEDHEPILDDRPSADLDRRAELVALRSDLTAALAELPAGLRAVVVLRDVYDLPHEAIAAELGISEGAAKVRLHRARLRLRERLFPPSGGGRRRGG
jgi:RNA polymerase sigma-70 factor, ECF subfamily